MLLPLSQILSLCPPPHSPLPLPQAIPTPLFMSMAHACNSLAAFFPILYSTSPWLFCNYLFVLLNPFTFSHIPPDLPSLW